MNFKVNVPPKILFTALVVLLLCLTAALSIAESVETTQQKSIELHPPQSKEEVEIFLRGKWRQMAWRRLGSGDDYLIYPDEANVYKTYSHGSFTLVSYGNEGQVWEFYGGRYEILDDLRVRETIEYYSPEGKTTPKEGSGGQLIYLHRETMVGATYEYPIKVEDNRLYQIGVLNQNVPQADRADYPGRLDADNGYEKIHH